MAKETDQHSAVTADEEEPKLPEQEDYPITNHKNRPGPPDGIIVHSMGEYIDGEFAADFLQDIGLSAHFLIDHTGKIFRCVDPQRQAYHAGKSRLGEQENLNSTFIGIELLVEGDHDYASFLTAIKDPSSFTDKHYDSCTWLCSDLMNQYSIPVDRVVRHSDVSGIDVRPESPKYDPGTGFDFDRFIQTINQKPNDT